ncbi:uncharacterized protein J7T54_002176 [Emericellopsis cladophorae]|uniref:Uncharacterized protein n=1 Tax=Emericellopsis cladophorae TaxID=2686198 RepID=A0A9P9Y4Y5_9HYPO|nr:uncharacterized protein J7T54_002176 [Emericellopsis cladophorae]KAI6783014.1 hypothetical protein J7T54_002176 [Emericellopsis cladophorae]
MEPSAASVPSSPRLSPARKTNAPHHQRSISDNASLQGHVVTNRQGAFPFSFIRSFQTNPSSTTLVHSVAEGKAIPVDNSTAENRTSALRELNNNYPSRHRYERSTGARSTTYSEPVIVRSYYAPQNNKPISTSRRGVVVHGGLGTVSQSGRSATARGRSMPFASSVATARNGMLSKLARGAGGKGNGSSPADETKLPPIEAFTFKGFMTNMDVQEAGSDINADLDRIAEICAKSRYSLSNQYEVHYHPHGSGSTFMGSPSGNDGQGPTLQVITSDDDRSSKRSRKRRNGARRSSRAMGTLETIMSSSRSSDEDKSKKNKSAAELAREVRGRAIERGSGRVSPVSAPSITTGDEHSPMAPKTPQGRRSASLALIDSSINVQSNVDTTSPRNSNSALLSEPAHPKASTSHLEIRTVPEREQNKENIPPPPANTVSQIYRNSTKRASLPANQPGTPQGFISTLTGWMPWRAGEANVPKAAGRAEGSLRELLRSTDTKGKGVQRDAS